MMEGREGRLQGGRREFTQTTACSERIPWGHLVRRKGMSQIRGGGGPRKCQKTRMVMIPARNPGNWESRVERNGARNATGDLPQPRSVGRGGRGAGGGGLLDPRLPSHRSVPGTTRAPGGHVQGTAGLGGKVWTGQNWLWPPSLQSVCS